MIKFHVDIKKREGNQFVVHNERKYVHFENTRHGIRLDFSIGVAGAMYSNKYNYRTEFNKDALNTIVKDDNNIFSPNFVGFFNTTLRSATNWAAGMSLGIGIDADSGTITFDNFFIGPSLVLGRYERILLTAGVSLKSLPTLKESYSSSSMDTDNDGIADNVIPNEYTMDNVAYYKYANGWFVSITYNLTNGIRKNIKTINNSY